VIATGGRKPCRPEANSGRRRFLGLHFLGAFSGVGKQPPGRAPFFATRTEQRKNRAAVGQTPVDGTTFFSFGPELLGFSFCNSDDELAGMWFGK
jgi:hypothetical protein